MIPPSSFPRRFFNWFFSWRTARRALLCAVGLVTLIVAVFVIEGWRGRRAWAEVVELARSRGEVLTVKGIIPALVSADENFAATPLVAALFSPDATVAKEAADRWIFSRPDDGKPEPGFAPSKESELSVLDAWRAYLGTDDLLVYLERYGADLDEISRATRLPYARFPIRYEDGIKASLPHVSSFRKLNQIMRLRAEARLERGQAGGAAADVAAMLRLARKTNEDPTLISQLMTCAMSGQAVQVVGAGLAKDAWTEADLTLIDASLAHLDLVGFGWRSFRGELAGVSTIFLQLAGEPEVMAAVLSMTSSPSPSRASRLASGCIPSGWIYQNAVMVARLFLDDILPAYDPKTRRVDFARLKALDERIQLGRKITPYQVLVHIFLVHSHNLGANFAAGQTQLNFARTAIALTRWKRAHGAYPESLTELSAPVSELRDYATGEPFHYQRNDDGTYLLYATGADGVDDDGTPTKGSGSADYTAKGDWVWLHR
jgi:hypothetical protein